MAKFYVYRHGSNSANQPMDNGPRLVATVEADSEQEATELAARRVTVYNNQFLSAEPAEDVDAEEAEIDRRVKLTDG